MAVAWSKDKVGRANGDVTIRDPVVLTATLPRFMLNGDRSHRAISKSTMSKGRRATTASRCRRAARLQPKAAFAIMQLARQAAQLRHGAADGVRRRHCRDQDQHRGTGELRA